MRVDFGQPSTIRGLIWIVIGLASIAAYFMGKDPAPLLAIGGTLSGAIGVAMDDNHKPAP